MAVPGEVSVAGYDDDTLARLSCFNLTTVSQGAREQARYAVAARAGGAAAPAPDRAAGRVLHR
ncbi:hypothetical protein GCM10010321_13710 [Streptomyces chartreusis]|nr:hypothetical protein GCM10010321_13710 [Streptomyces chartreusis]